MLRLLGARRLVTPAASVPQHRVNNLRSEIRDSFFSDSQTYGADNAGLALYGTNTAWKIENNIFWKTFPGIECQNSTSANYFGYNFGAQVEAGWEFSGAMFSDNHGPHDMMNLWEGNAGEMFQSDGYFGSGSHGTLFRNHFTAQNPAKTGNFKAISLDRWSYYYNVVGNVLGGPGTTFAYYEADVDGYGYENATIFRLGYPNLGNNGFQSDGASPNGIDAMVRGTLLRVGNYDYFHECVWDDATGACLDAAASAALDLPDSLYYDAEPTWWPGGKAWPPLAPERDGFDADAPTKIPAQDCFEQLDLANGGAFDADSCYAGAGSGTGGSDEAGSDDAADTSGGNGSAGSIDDGPGGTMASSGSGEATSGDQNGDGDGGCGCTPDSPRDRSWLLVLLFAIARRPPHPSPRQRLGDLPDRVSVRDPPRNPPRMRVPTDHAAPPRLCPRSMDLARRVRRGRTEWPRGRRIADGNHDHADRERQRGRW